MKTSGDRLKALLHECGLTSSDFAAQRGVTLDPAQLCPAARLG
jgi:hypothetical protein